MQAGRIFVPLNYNDLSLLCFLLEHMSYVNVPRVGRSSQTNIHIPHRYTNVQTHTNTLTLFKRASPCHMAMQLFSN